MRNLRALLIIPVLIATFLLVYFPHYDYPFPRHIDEWHHISETIRLQRGEYPGGLAGFRIGFHVLLLPLSKIANLVVIYQFFPAIWAIFSALLLFYLVYKKTGNQFYIALFAMIFFASIKSNVNIMGLWFFTPLSFSIPFIYLYVYLFTEGVERQKKGLILLSLTIMLFLLFVHSISVLFAAPFMLIYTLFHFRYLKKEWLFFSFFLAIPVIGAIFYRSMARIPWESLASNLFNALQFKRGWGVLEVENSFFELYSLAGYISAFIGLALIFKNRESIKKYLAYGLWPIMVLTAIMFYRKTDVSYLSPYQRNLYYFAISLPLLSAFGLDYVLKAMNQFVEKIQFMLMRKDIFKKVGAVLFSVIVIFFTFAFYFDIPKRIDLYKIIEDGEYDALLFLSTLPEKSTVMAVPRISEAVYPVSGHWPVATYFFYGNRKDVELFFQTDNCRAKQRLLDKYNVKYVLSKSPVNCGWKLIYQEKDYIYEID